MRLTPAKIAGVAVLLAGGVACTPPPPDGVLAIAYVNADGIDGYDESAEVLIAKLADTSADGIVSVGDTIITSRYPLGFDASAFGTFSTTTHTVTAVIYSTRGQVLVTSGDLPDQETFMFFRAVHLFPLRGGEGYLEAHDIWSPPVPHASFEDSFGDSDGDQDRIEAEIDAPSGPETAVSISHESPTDDPFIDVDIYVG